MIQRITFRQITHIIVCFNIGDDKHNCHNIRFLQYDYQGQKNSQL